ncbi:breast cancer 2 like protein, partial [Nannochloropsis gaditana CCMP526]|uniref:breast cancer 2 like protein n=1 Tax=Nannochloropsis gaditana (strain CCMP526) TaxID=1093141 RepID=UPI00029F6435
GVVLGFQTGRGRQVAVSEEALAKVSHLFEESGGGGSTKENGVSESASVGGNADGAAGDGVVLGFQSGRGRQVAVSEEAL